MTRELQEGGLMPKRGNSVFESPSEKGRMGNTVERSTALSTIMRQMRIRGSISLILAHISSLSLLLSSMAMIRGSNALVRVLGMFLFRKVGNLVSRNGLFISGCGLSVREKGLVVIQVLKGGE